MISLDSIKTRNKYRLMITLFDIRYISLVRYLETIEELSKSAYFHKGKIKKFTRDILFNLQNHYCATIVTHGYLKRNKLNWTLYFHNTDLTIHLIKKFHLLMKRFSIILNSFEKMS
tara:strand:+ start:41232 stop:41579 length:348 start_codon:yes stop_codon:yes gene_type:complete